MIFLFLASRICSLVKLRKHHSVSFGKLHLFEGVIEDFVGKKYGAGQFFYGVRTSREHQSASATLSLKPNAVLVVGAAESSVCQTILIELLEKGFPVRYACDDSIKAFQLFGPSGFNFDIVELHKGSFFSRSSPEKDFAVAIKDVQALVICDLPEGQPSHGVYSSLSQKIIDISFRAQQAGVLHLKKIVLLTDSQSLTVSSKQQTLLKLIEANHVEYVALHVPQLIASSKAGTGNDLELYDAGIGQVALEVTKDIASADLAEVAVQILLQDVFGNVTLTVLSSRSENGTLANPSMRIRRDAFYRVYAQGGEVFSVEQASRDAACRQLKAWHAVRPIEDIKKQLQEDEAVERYWIVKFQILAKQLAEKFL